MSGDHSTTITPGSDDCITVSGYITEEFSHSDFAGGVYVMTNIGSIIRFRLEDEGWRATIVCDPGDDLEIQRARPENPGDDSDESVRVVWPLEWVVATTTAPARR